MIKQDGQISKDELVVESLNIKDDVASKGRFKAWKDQETVKLNEAVEMFGNNWELISKSVGRSKDACVKRYQRNKEKEWTDVEIELLKQYLKLNGSDWKKTSEALGKTIVACQNKSRRIGILGFT